MRMSVYANFHLFVYTIILHVYIFGFLDRRKDRRFGCCCHLCGLQPSLYLFVYVTFRIFTYTHKRKCECLSMRIFGFLDRLKCKLSWVAGAARGGGALTDKAVRREPGEAGVHRHSFSNRAGLAAVYLTVC
jgi:hypothetical protein